MKNIYRIKQTGDRRQEDIKTIRKASWSVVNDFFIDYIAHQL